jgi:hypothetical protein
VNNLRIWWRAAARASEPRFVCACPPPTFGGPGPVPRSPPPHRGAKRARPPISYSLINCIHSITIFSLPRSLKRSPPAAPWRQTRGPGGRKMDASAPEKNRVSSKPKGPAGMAVEPNQRQKFGHCCVLKVRHSKKNDRISAWMYVAVSVRAVSVVILTRHFQIFSRN